MALNQEINLFLYTLTTVWVEYDYGEEYRYQCLDSTGVSGLRNTGARVEAMGLMSLSENKSIIDIGCNMEFLALDLAKVARSIIGCDVNPHLIEITGAAASYGSE